MHIAKIVPLVGGLLLFSQDCYCQPFLQWARIYNGTANGGDDSYSLKADDSGYVYVTGGSNGVGTGVDYCTIKYGPNGDTLWIRRYNGQENGLDYGTDLIIGEQGNIYVTGRSVTIKYNSNGDSLWVRRFVGTFFGGHRILLDHSNKLYVMGFTQGIWVLQRYTTAGQLLWSRNDTTSFGSQPYEMTVDKWGNIIVVGSNYLGGSGNSYDFTVMKYDSSGSRLWMRSYNGPDPSSPFDAAYAVAVDTSGNIYAAGESGDINGTSNYITFKFTPDGDSIWIRRFNIGGSAAYDIAVDNNGNAYITGVTSVYNYTTIKYSPSGQLLWQQTIPGVMFPPWNKLTLDSSNNVYVAATSARDGTADMIIVKYSSSGNQQWVGRYPNSGLNAGVSNDIALDVAGNVYVTGRTSQFSDSYLTVKYSQIVGITPVSNVIPAGFRLHQNFPNPFNFSTQIRFDVPNIGNVELAIYDILGRQVSVLVNELLKPGSYKINWSPEKRTSSGLYFVRLVSNGQLLDGKKIILVK